MAPYSPSKTESPNWCKKDIIYSLLAELLIKAAKMKAFSRPTFIKGFKEQIFNLILDLRASGDLDYTRQAVFPQST